MGFVFVVVVLCVWLYFVTKGVRSFRERGSSRRRNRGVSWWAGGGDASSGCGSSSSCGGSSSSCGGGGGCGGGSG